MSDIHSEHDPNYKFPYDKKQGKNQILILAGDTCSSRGIIEFMKRFHESRFDKVLFVAGNHEFYGNYFHDVLKKLKKNFAVKNNNRIQFLDNNVVEIEDVSFLGCTLWSDFNKQDPACVEAARGCMNDYHLIRIDDNPGPYSYGFTKFQPEDSYKEHLISKRFLEEKLKENHKKKKKTVVITHMAPSSLSVHDMYKGDVMNGAYFSDLSEMILDYEPNIWIHGHTHSSFDYILGKTRIICNPQGYKTDLNPDFIKELIVEI